MKPTTTFDALIATQIFKITEVEQIIKPKTNESDSSFRTE